VIDLAPYFGKNLVPSPDRNMMLIANGDFRVLLAVETVLGRRRLALNLQKELPVHLSEDVVYGCYLDENAVTLILNIASMAFRAEGLNTNELPGVLSAMEPPGAKAQDISIEPSRKTEYTDRQEIEAESKTASVIIEKAEIEKDEFSEIPVIDEKATVNGAASVLLPESEIEADALKGDSQGKEEIEGETAIPVSEAETAPESEEKPEALKGDRQGEREIEGETEIPVSEAETAPESEEKPGALKGDSQGKEEIEGETEIPVSEAETVPESEREAAAQEETSDTEAGLHKMEEAAAAGRLETKETEQSSQLQASPSLEDTGKKDVDKTFRGKKRIWYIIASILAICLLFAIYFVFAPADWKPGDTGTSIKKETITTEKEIPAFPSDSASEEDGKTGETDQAGREETVISYLTHFPPDSSLLLPGEIDNLMRIAASIKQDSPIKIIITGHTDRVGTEESCLILSEERAEAVRNKLISLSAFDESKVTTRGAGASEPIADQSTPEGRSRNRRAEIRLVY
jgi:outer membrane protein OmpA-like peptidoglycan-associated protein